MDRIKGVRGVALLKNRIIELLNEFKKRKIEKLNSRTITTNQLKNKKFIMTLSNLNEKCGVKNRKI
ncbi:hypothetical protein BpHYR1_008619 [Brachionus plicatilis]|uniref:Uncharacterized protein n=1 Tax=Brachionus plicatilis TaxID=10195 RepID=A0A3M7S9C0_BRAPC|nr:hypothetical protein BpHYR1_008619 [Brachionus plicatilis]